MQGLCVYYNLRCKQVRATRWQKTKRKSETVLVFFRIYADFVTSVRRLRMKNCFFSNWNWRGHTLPCPWWSWMLIHQLSDMINVVRTVEQTKKFISLSLSLGVASYGCGTVPTKVSTWCIHCPGNWFNEDDWRDNIFSLLLIPSDVFTTSEKEIGLT